MVRLHEDDNFHYEAIRAIALTRYYGGDIAEIFGALDRIRPGNFEDWYREWKDLAERALSTIDESKLDSYSPITLRDIYLRASRYYFVADFFLHGNPNDPRLYENYKIWRSLFDKGNALLPIPGEHLTIKTPHGFSVKALLYRAPGASKSNPRPTLIAGGGFDSNLEELVHVFGFAALERDFNILIYEGPGHLGLLHEQKKGFIYDWEKAVTPIVDYIVDHNKTDLAYIDASKMGLIGYSMGGYLCTRAAAFEPRLAAVIAIDGVWSFGDCCLAVYDDGAKLFKSGDKDGFNKLFEKTNEKSSTNERWFHDQLKFSFRSNDGFEIFKEMEKMTLEGIIDKIKMPAFIGDASHDIFFLGQPKKVADELANVGGKPTLWAFDDKQAAGAHCQSGALVYLNQSILEWFGKVVGGK